MEADPLKQRLKLPDGADFHPVPWVASIEAITRLSEERLPLINGRPGVHEDRLARRAKVRFRL